MAEENKPIMDQMKFYELFEKLNTDNPDPDDLNLLRQEYSKNLQYYYKESNAGQIAIKDMVERVQTNDWGKEQLKMNVKAVQQALGYDESPAIEKLLIENVAMCWLNMTLMEMFYSQNTIGDVKVDTKWLDYCERRLSSVQKRYLRAIETLARVRKVTVSTIQINLAAHGAKQLNVANLHQKDKDKEE